jgi:hypothetical protein
MATSRKYKKKVNRKRSSGILILEKGKLSEKLILVIVGVFIILGVGLFVWKPWQSLSLPFVSHTIAATKPALDIARARQLSVDPSKDTVMQITTREHVLITLTVPKGALKEKTLVKLIPFHYDKKSRAPTAGVVVAPASIGFEVPVTLAFNFSESEFKNQAPKTAIEKKIRMTGLAQVMQVDSAGKSLTPTLIARGIETDAYLPARILTGGAYVFSLDGKNQVDIAKQALDKDGMHTLTVMEAATVLMFNNKKLTESELKTTKSAVAKILSKKSPPPFELFAALVLQKKIKDNSFSLMHLLIPKVYAYETGEGYYQAVCRADTFTIEQYLGFAKAAQLMGYDHIGDSCINKAKNKVAEDAKKVLSGNPDVKSIMIALQNLQLLGVDEETNLDEQLEEKAKEVVTKDAQKVASDPNSSVVDAAVQMQKMEAVGADSGSTYESLKERVNAKVNQVENDVDKANGEYSKEMEQKEADWNEAAKKVEEDEKRLEEQVNSNDIDEEAILVNAAWSQIGIAFLKMAGFDELDKDSLKKKFDEMQSQAKEVAQLGYEACLEAQAEGFDMDCSGLKSKTDDLLKQAEELSYRAENEIGNMQSQEYETPEYLENNGDFELYFEEDLTPTPEDGTEVGDEEEQSDEGDDSDSYDYWEEQTTDGTGSEDASESDNYEIDSTSGDEE